MKPSDLIGVYSLEAFTVAPPKGEHVPWGAKMTGLLIYTDSGYMSVAINRAVPDPKPKDWTEIDDVLFYSGTYEIVSGAVLHRVTQATDPAKIGKELRREILLEGSRLTLTGPAPDGGVGRVVWRKKV